MIKMFSLVLFVVVQVYYLSIVIPRDIKHVQIKGDLLSLKAHAGQTSINYWREQITAPTETKNQCPAGDKIS